ncbi:uncharacterized protein EV154DRAFT_501497 [Mucor mucedo]|uniref:uncharacterized protein n=1 Tax=Mucor mucedo TaxID=29922 RepID=UPI00221E9499|nr:uncharacterized protein EV154DRAFT_501497 [Mucor mucedo]KAI7893537.1 hypothetical protein EV154DRAFT_501497 [Mucor mucedo]
MGGVTIAHQHEIATDESFASSYPANMNSTNNVDQEQFNQLLATSGQWPTNDLPVEDLTGEVQDLMMRESMNSWLQPWMGENAACLTDFDTQMYAQSIQLEDLFGQDQLNFTQDMTQSSFYDELTFAHEESSLDTSAPTSSASSPSDSSAHISPIVQPVTDIMIDTLDEESVGELEEVNVVLQVDSPMPTVATANVADIATDIPQERVVENVLKRRRGSSSSEESSDGSSSSEEESDSEDENEIIPTTVANMNSRRRASYSSSDDSESDAEPIHHHHRSRASSPSAGPYMYMHKRQIEETLLDRITNQLNPEKLPGILPILSSEKASNQQEDEVEIDLSCLAREQLVQVLSYVDACILEQNGGPAVNVDNYITKKPAKKGPRTRPALNHSVTATPAAVVMEEPKRRPAKQRSRKPCKPTRTKSRAELTEDIDADSSSSESANETISSSKSAFVNGPMSMASLSKNTSTALPSSTKLKNGRHNISHSTMASSKKSSSHHSSNTSKACKKQNRRKADDDAMVASSIHVFPDPDSIASSRPKRRAAIHKRRLLEEMLAPSDNEADEDSEDSVLVVYSDEQMDLQVVDNRTIMHQVPVPVQLISTQTEVVAIATATTDTEDSEDTDEDIDIMC